MSIISGNENLTCMVIDFMKGVAHTFYMIRIVDVRKDFTMKIGYEEEPIGKMVLIPDGEFEMGSNDVESEPDEPPIGWTREEFLLTRMAAYDEQPVHRVSVSSFYMDIYPVTNIQYKKFLDANPLWQKEWKTERFYLRDWEGGNYPSSKAYHPIEVDWYAAMAYAEWAGRRLPTEAEWEKAARGGLVGMQYPWGNTRDSRLANSYVFEERLGCYIVYHDGDTHVNYTTPVWLQKLRKKMKNRTRNTRTTAVGSYPPNGYGLYDIVGNIGEWCIDSYDADFYSKSPHKDPLNLGEELQCYENTLDNIDLILNDYKTIQTPRVRRGGRMVGVSSWPFVRVARRDRGWPSGDYSGFRCATSIMPEAGNKRSRLDTNRA